MTQTQQTGPRSTGDATATGRDTALRIAAELPFLRRYARALTGSQARGDAQAAETLRAIIDDRTLLDDTLRPRVALFQAFHAVWEGAGPSEPAATPAEARARARLAELTPRSREALLLRTVEEFRIEEIATILKIAPDLAEALVAQAVRDMQGGLRGRVLVIEDEPLIAMDITDIVGELGHTVTGVARTHREALDLGARDRPDLILADIQLADNSSGIEAVNALLQRLGDVPVVFITAFPDRLLTGEKPEPAFLITKPFTAEQVRSAVSQAIFFASTETLMA
ncbi:MAG: response regulator [Alkalilacustris sp.]